MWCITCPHKYTIHCSNTVCPFSIAVRTAYWEIVRTFVPVCVFLSQKLQCSFPRWTIIKKKGSNIKQAKIQLIPHQMKSLYYFYTQRHGWFIIHILNNLELWGVVCQLHHLRLIIYGLHLCPGHFSQQQTPGFYYWAGKRDWETHLSP